MAGLLNVGARALLANQVALATIGHNISNANTVGYSRQSVVLQTVDGQYTGGGYIGKGVDVYNILRNHSEYLTQQAAATKSIASADITRTTKLQQLEDIFPGGTTGLGAAVSAFLNAFSDVASAPTDLTARTVVLTRAQELTARFRAASEQLDSLQLGVNDQLQTTVDSINSLSSRIADLNGQISLAKGSGKDPNDLLDKRDQLINEMNQYIQTTQIPADDGTVGVFAANSQPLVLGINASPLSLTPDQFDPTKMTLAIKRGSTIVQINEDMIGGGDMKGLLQFQNSDLQEGRNLLGRMALTITTEVNAQHRLGLDLDGNLGGDLFTPITIPDGAPATLNTGTATIGVTIADTTKLQASDYEVRFTAVGVDVVRQSDGQLTSFPGVPITIDGLTLDITAGGAATGDRFLVQPYSHAAGDTGVAFASPRALAVANPVEAQMATTNTGGLSVTNLKALSVPQPAAVTITFQAGGTYTRSDTGATTYPYVAGQPIVYAAGPPATGWSLTLNGTPQAGDSLDVRPATTAFAVNNAGNAGALLGLQDKKVFDGASMADGYAGLMAKVGIRVQSSQNAAQVSASIADSIESDRAGVSGVNLDEEAARLLQYQQAYQASAKMIQIAQSIFDSLIQTVSR